MSKNGIGCQPSRAPAISWTRMRNCGSCATAISGPVANRVQDEKLELGRLFDQYQRQDRAQHTEQVWNVLDPVCFEIRENKPRTEHEVMNLACLVGRDQQKAFEEGVFAAAKFFDHHYAFDFNGPWPPHNFVDVAWPT